jgi:hypothetical protein
MTTLTIHRLGADVPADLDQADPARVERLLRLVADRALEDRHSTYGELSGEWFVRRLDLDLDLASDEPDATAAARWAGLIAGAIRDLVPDGSNVLHFRSRSRLLLDLVAGVAVGELTRTWAWRQAGLVTASDPDPADQPGPALLAALGREPRLAVPILVQAVQQVGVRAVHAVLGPAGWSAVADLIRPGWRNAAQTTPAGVGRAELEHRAAAVLAASALAEALRSAGAPDPVVRSAWAVLVLAEVDPAADLKLLPWISAGLTDAAARGPADAEAPEAPTPVAAEPPTDTSGPLVRDPAAAGPQRTPPPAPDPTPSRADPTPTPTARAIAGAKPATGPAAPGRFITEQHIASPAPAQPGHAAHASPAPIPDPTTIPPPSVAAAPAPRPAGSADRRTPDQVPATTATEPEPEVGAPTNWAGLLFLLNAAAAADVPDAVAADVRLAGRPLRWVLHSLALRLVPIRAEDPAALALAGLTPTMLVPAGPPAEPVEEQALDQYAAQWATAVVHLLEQARHPQDDSPLPTLWSLARRPGRIVADPGWLEVQLNLDDIDLLVRRAGLDLDPGWLGWLGTVVMFRYV